MTASEGARGPLDGVRVVDLSPDRVGAQVSQTLADYGADVVWVETPGGSRLRQERAFPFFGRGKSSLIADLKTSVGVEQVLSLAGQADVLIETFRPGVADRLGLGYEGLAASNPGLVYTSISGFGRRGPWADLKGYEGIVASVLGIYGSFGGMTQGDHPPFVTVPWCTFAASHGALQGILSALIERSRSGRGQWVETNLAQAVTIHEGASSAWYTYLVTSRWPDAFAAAPATAHHFVFRLLVGQTKDGRWLQFAQNRPHLFESFMRALQLEWMLTDPKWKGIPLLEDASQREELMHCMLDAVRGRTLDEWKAIFESDRDVYAELYRDGPEVLDHPQLVHDRAIIEVADPKFGLVRQPGPQFAMTTTPGVVRRPAPILDGGLTSWWTGRPEFEVEATDTAPLAPLDGVTVLELAVQYAAPYGPTMLADLGARVIKVEQLEGDSIRRQVPQFPEIGSGKVMQGKESVAIDIRTPEGREILHRLVTRADVIVNGFRSGADERGGFDFETLRKIKPDIVYVNATGYGLGEPCGDRASFALSFGAAGGIAAAHLGGPGPQDPSISFDEVVARSNLLRSASATKYASADGIGALGVATAALLGLLARQRGLGGQRIVSSMLLSTAHAMVDHVIDVPGGPEGLDAGEEMRGPVALYRIYDASNGWLFLAAPQAGEWDALTDALVPYVNLRDDVRFGTKDARQRNNEDLVRVLAEIFVTRTKEDWQRDLTSVDVACVAVTTGPVEGVLMSDEYGRASGYLVDVTHPVFDSHPRLAPIVGFSRSIVQARSGDLCGTATDAVLEEFGYSEDQIAELHAKGVVG